MSDSRPSSAERTNGFPDTYNEGSPSNTADDACIVPTPPPYQFLLHLFNHPETPTRELVQPYLSYETWLRKAFTKADPGVSDLAGVVPIYDGHEILFKSRAIDRRKADGSKYLMRLPRSLVPPDRSPAIALPLSEYMRNFEAFTHGQLFSLMFRKTL